MVWINGKVIHHQTEVAIGSSSFGRVESTIADPHRNNIQINLAVPLSTMEKLMVPLWKSFRDEHCNVTTKASS